MEYMHQRQSGGRRLDRHDEQRGFLCDRQVCGSHNLNLRATRHLAGARVVLLLLIVRGTVFPASMMHGAHAARTIRRHVSFVERRLAAAGDPETASRKDQDDDQRCDLPPHHIGEYTSLMLMHQLVMMRREARRGRLNR